MPGISHHEVRRHPRWREEQNTPQQSSQTHRVSGSRLIGVVGLLIVATTLLVLLLSG